MHSEYHPIPTECTPLQPANAEDMTTAAHIPMNALGSEQGVRKRVGSSSGVDMETEEYLEPTASLPRRPKGTHNKPQYDSGVSDMEGFHPSSDPIGYTNGGLPTNHATAPLGSPKRLARPDSVSKGPHLYEELPARYANPHHEYDPNKMTPRNVTTPAPAFSKASLVPSPIPSSTENLFRNSNHSNTSLPSQHQMTGAQTPFGRKRENPLYEEGSHDDLKPSNRGWLQPPCLGIILILLFAFALLTFVLVLLLLTGFLPKEKPEVIEPMTSALTGDDETEFRLALHRLAQLEASYADLTDKHAIAVGNLTAMQSVIAHQSEQIVTLSGQVSTLETQLESMENTINVQFGDDGVNTLVGPQGPPGPVGVANFSVCQHVMLQRGSSALAPFVQTTWWPENEADSLNNVLIGLECSTDIGNSSFVQSQEHPDHPGVIQYCCECRGSTDATASVRYCQLHVWHCPKTA